MSVDLNWWKDVPSIIEDDNDALREYILDPQIPIHEPESYFYPRKPDESRLYFVAKAPASTTIIPKRCPHTAEILDFIEVPVDDVGCDATNSMSLKRAPGPLEEATRGSAVNYPFWPGGFDEDEDELKKEMLNLNADNFDFENNLLTIAPGFTEGIETTSSREQSVSKTIDLLALIDDDEENDLESLIMNTEVKVEEAVKAEKNMELDSNVDALLVENKASSTVLKISDSTTVGEEKLEYAEMLDVFKPISDFYQKIPDMAHKYPFELDNFQKQAILQLEEHNHVFVAAHTSAGKTVVAEYAIALSKRNMTKAIYTSPIKALSNQKYRDFKQTFKEVGLITGDIQIDSESQCLIMTTEILRSMLYCGSDVIRDLEYVIFDEVHYITDQDRGHVWEEVLILLPDHVCIVMLSATVPNTLQFANWVGRTKKRKVYVISTLKRPVPLKHYLYTGNGGKSRDDIFQIVDESSVFSMAGYEKAKEMKESRQTEYQKQMQDRKLNAKQEQTLWVGLVDHLRRKDKLPVVAFTLSRNRCDANAEALKSVELCSGREKFHIHSFFNRCLLRLKVPDRTLPQVIMMRDCLTRGVGIHHSGILPILKEIVEMLFQSGFVKLLFATETFAMGVNMPARTVIFDSTSKFDGVQSRCLQPAEYTQMAGRAGRRGLDDNGTVIIICKSKIPPEQMLRQMILGKPMLLESQFRLTYAMILSLLRVERVTVEDMMSHSFREYGKQIQMPEHKEKLKIAEAKISTTQELGDDLRPLCLFHDICFDYIAEWNRTMPILYTHAKIVKELRPGRVLIVTHKHFYNRLAILLWTSSASYKETSYKVLILDNEVPTTPSANDRGLLWHRMMALSLQYQVFIREGIGGHAVLTIQPKDIVEITKTNMKIEADKIIQNWDQRQIPRFKDSPVGASTTKAIGELTNLNNAILSEVVQLEYITHNLDFHLLDGMKNLEQLKIKLEQVRAHTDISSFESVFGKVFDRKQLEKQLDDLKFKMSSKNLTLYPDYMNKLHVLEDMQYIDELHQVAMKGRVACEMGQNELIITELVLRNILTDMDPSEIAALLSALVFQAETTVTPCISERLKKGEQQFMQVDADIRLVEAKYKVNANDETLEKDRLNFGLTEVVYEWARNKPFSEIMQLTDIKEGIIVRCIQQLHETLRNVKEAARIIGDPILHKKMEEASNAIKRDIVFAASLYTTNEIITVVNND